MNTLKFTHKIYYVCISIIYNKINGLKFLPTSVSACMILRINAVTPLWLIFFITQATLSRSAWAMPERSRGGGGGGGV